MKISPKLIQQRDSIITFDIIKLSLLSYRRNVRMHRISTFPFRVFFAMRARHAMHTYATDTSAFIIKLFLIVYRDSARDKTKAVIN